MQVNNVDHILTQISELHPKQMRAVFMTMWRDMDGLNDGLTADDCIEIFASALKGSSDFTYDLLAQTCADYEVGTMTETFALLPRPTYDKLFSDCLKGDIPLNTRLDTVALTNLLMLENVANVEASIRNSCIRATHFIDSDGKFIYDSGVDDEENQWEIDEFREAYPKTWWTIEQIIFNY
ncbi:hypothetical protein [Neisseria wadsworthii]|uniref:Uncharacterized protein n=1 Tax=Neisseria wadsworthii 9715 TaxID=1030841 RepID=G4CN34_9NEIS|nr:hypothetical protein [Neisseria wadsworthii]EGZ50644.1 hypothetical protein HMPREF9370_0493 [Neisseria wadsworthii 9715]QMT36488.1 hypothetical protein H3L96_04525 [Neisseria wadsworthii]